MVGNAWDNQNTSPDETECLLWVRLSPSVMLYFVNDGTISNYPRKDNPHNFNWIKR